MTEPAIVPHQVFAFIRDVRGDGRDPIYDRKHLDVALENRMHLGPVDDGTALGMIAHLLQRERDRRDRLGEFLTPGLVPAVNAHLVMNAEAGVPPAQQLLDQHVIDLALPSQHREDLVPKEQLEFLEIDVGDDIQPAVGRKQAI